MLQPFLLDFFHRSTFYPVSSLILAMSIKQTVSAAFIAALFVQTSKSHRLYPRLCNPLTQTADAAIVSLYIPGQGSNSLTPFTADKLGVDPQGRTSWRIAIGTASGSFTDAPTGTDDAAAAATGKLYACTFPAYSAHTLARA